MVSIKELSDEDSEINVTKDPIESTEAMDQKELENAPIPPDQVIEIEEPQTCPTPQGEDTNDEESQSQTAESNDQNDAQTKKIFVGGLPHGLSEQELRGFFVEFGNMTDIVIIHNKETGRARGFGFVVFDSYEAANNVLKQRFYNIKSKQVEVKRAIPRQQQISRSNAATTFVSGQPQINHHLDSSTYHYYRGAYYNTQSYHPYYHNPTFLPNTYYSYGSRLPGIYYLASWTSPF